MMSVPWYKRRREKGARKRSVVEDGLKKILTNMFDSEYGEGNIIKIYRLYVRQKGIYRFKDF